MCSESGCLHSAALEMYFIVFERFLICFSSARIIMGLWITLAINSYTSLRIRKRGKMSHKDWISLHNATSTLQSPSPGKITRLCGVNKFEVTTCIFNSLVLRVLWSPTISLYDPIQRLDSCDFHAVFFNVTYIYSISIFLFFVPSITWRHNNLSETLKMLLHWKSDSLRRHFTLYSVCYCSLAISLCLID